MCEMCAYIGRERSAAPILLAQGKRMEGLWSGFCTGIGVQDADGTLRMHKTLGYSRFWEEQFSTASLPGTVGVFHSRTGYPGMSGDRRYAHPFLSADGSAMVAAQGFLGIFSDESSRALFRIGNRLLELGVCFSSADSSVKERFQLLKDGTRVHMTNIFGEYAAYLLKLCKDPFEAVRRTGNDIREEACSFFLFREFPGHVYAINMNQRLCARFHADGLSISTCALAFGAEHGNLMEIPPTTVADFTADSIRMERLSPQISPYSEIPANLRGAVLEWLAGVQDGTLAEIMDNVLKLRYPADTLRHVPTHEIFEQLYFDGVIQLMTREQPGITGRECSLRTSFRLNRQDC